MSHMLCKKPHLIAQRRDCGSKPPLTLGCRLRKELQAPKCADGADPFIDEMEALLKQADTALQKIKAV